MTSVKYNLDINHYLEVLDKYFDMYHPLDYTHLKFLPTLRLPIDRGHPVHIRELEYYKRIGGADKYISNTPYQPWRCLEMVKTAVLDMIYTSYDRNVLDIFKTNYIKSDGKCFITGLEIEEVVFSYLGDMYITDMQRVINVLGKIYNFITPIIEQAGDETLWNIEYDTNYVFLVNVGNIYKYRYRELL